MTGILEGKKILVMGVANKKSIAWGCVQAIKAQGGEVILTYQNERMKKSIDRMVDDGQPMVECDVAEDSNVEKAFKEIKDRFGKIDGVVHAIAYADRETLKNGVINTQKDGYNLAQDVSAYSLISVTRYAKEVLNQPGSIVTLTYLGSIRAIPNYNMMGIAKASLEASVRYLAAELGKDKIRVNAISAGAVKTLAVTGIKGHDDLLKMSDALTVDNESVTKQEIGNVATFLMSDLSTGMTGDILFADKGVHLMGG